MKSLFLIFGLWSINLIASAQSDSTVRFNVAGICSMCKERIENAAYIKGVRFAEWNKNTHLLTVIFKPKKVTVEAIQKSITRAGHDTEALKATEEEYNKIHDCCKYREQSENH